MSTPDRGDLIVYRTEDGQAEVQLQTLDGSVWLNQGVMAELFDTTKQNVSLHIKNILKEGELPEASVVKEYSTTAEDGKRYQTKHYNLHMILAVGYRVRSPRGTQFRQWATAHLAEYLVKGFVMDDERLKNLFLREIEERITAREDFAFETTLAGRTYLRLIERLHSDGWRMELIYLALPSVEMSKLRVAERVAHGGHNIPVKDSERRFPRSLRHLLNGFSHRIDSCTCFMNDGESPVLVFEQRGSDRDIVHDDYYQHLLEEAQR